MKGYVRCRYCDPFGDSLRHAAACPATPFNSTQETTPTVPTPDLTLTEDSAARKDTPMARGVLDYFPAALAYVAQVSAYGNAKHNPDSEALTWTRSKSYDHADCIIRHLADRGLSDDAGIRHSGYVAWRALALLQTELEAEGAAPGRASAFDDAEPVGAGVSKPHPICGIDGRPCPMPRGCARPCPPALASAVCGRCSPSGGCTGECV